MKPSIGPTQGKLWGETQCVFSLNGIEAYPIHVRKGGFCSQHSHVHKWNRFCVLSGSLTVRIWNNGNDPDVSIIKGGQVSDVPPGVVHEFEAMEDTIAIEFYWTELDPADIVRVTKGGVRSG